MWLAARGRNGLSKYGTAAGTEPPVGLNPMRLAGNGNERWGRRSKAPSAAAFSLVELIVVLAIMLLVLWMGREGYLRERARQRMAHCAKNLGGQFVALQTYANDHDGWFPLRTNATSPDEPLSLLVPTYTTQTEFWICPASGDRVLKAAEPFAGRRISYAYYMGWRRDAPAGSVLVTDEQIDSQAKIQHQLLFSTSGRRPANNHGDDGGNYLRTDGSQGHSPSHAAIDFPLPDHITLLNPKSK